jgi:hypothetical protein
MDWIRVIRGSREIRVSLVLPFGFALWFALGSCPQVLPE